MSSISVIIPAYNAEKFIGEAIESVLNQTRPAKEIIVVDDASTDRTAEIARSFGARVKVLVNEVNSGPGHSRNAGVAASTGDYLAFLDADDCFKAIHLEVMGGLLDRWPQAGMAVSCIERFGKAEAEALLPWRMEACVDVPTDMFALAMRNHIIYTGNHVVRRAIFDSVGGFQDIVEYANRRRIQAEDNDLFLRVSARFKIIASPIPSVRYRIHAQQSSAQLVPQRIMLYRYRVRMVRSLAASNPAQSALGLDRLIRGWEELLEDLWKHRKQSELRAFVGYGAREPLLRTASMPYVMKAFMPSYLVKLRDRLTEGPVEGVPP